MGSSRSNERDSTLETATYANSLRVPLKRSGIFLKNRPDRAVGLVLPPGADIEVYRTAVKLVLTEAGLLHYSVPNIHVSKFSEKPDDSDVAKTLSLTAAVIVLIEHGAEISPEVMVSLDDIVELSAIKPYHLTLAGKTKGILISREQAAALLTYPPQLLFAAIRQKRSIEISLAKLSELAAPPRKVKWEPRIEDLAGYGRATPWALELAEDIAAWRQGVIDWNDVDAGLLLSGPPGSGKTLFASAVARSCGAKFFAASSAQWQAHGHLGDMLKAMRRTFREAIASAPSILFLDEFDSFGARGTLKGDNAAYGLQVINALLELLDGSAGREGVVVIAATNRPEDIDDALRRPGRLDRHIEIEMPDRAAREQILSTHLGTTLPSDELRSIALATSGYSGAALRQLARDARRTARRDRRGVCTADVLRIVPPVATLSDAERWPACIHEAGHAVVGLELGIGKIDAIVVAREVGYRDDSFGHVQWTRSAVRNLTLKSFRNEIAMLLAGRAAETTILNRVYAGSGGMEGSDLHRATDIATVLVASHGLEALSFTSTRGSRELDELRRGDPLLRKRVERLLAEELVRAETIIALRRADVLRVAEIVMQREVVSGSEVAGLVAGLGRVDPPKPDK